MKKLIIISLIIVSGILSSQSLKPIVGIKFTGGISYEMEHEYFGGVLGAKYAPINENAIFADVIVSGEYVYDYLQEFNGKHNLYILRAQFAKPVNDFVSFTYFGGYMNILSENTRQNFKPLKTNIVWGAGIRLISDELIAEALYENLGGYPHISIGVVFPLWELLRK